MVVRQVSIAVVCMVMLAGCGNDGGTSADPCNGAVDAYCANTVACGADACSGSNVRTQVMSNCDQHRSSGTTDAQVQACTDHLKAGSDCGNLAASTNPCNVLAP